jgi:hypothetical protein
MIKDLSIELMTIYAKYNVRGVSIIIDDQKKTVHSASNMNEADTLEMIKAFSHKFTPKNVETIDEDAIQLKIKNPNIN